MRKIMLTLVALALVLTAGGQGLQEQPKYGGTLRYAMYGEPPTLDMHVTTSVLSSVVAHHIFEGLFEFTPDYTAVPHLLKKYEYQDGGKVVIFYLRQGVLFHNGKEMTAEDVIASINRWGQYGLKSKELYDLVVDLKELDPYTIRMELKEPFGPLPAYLANIYGGPRIYPKEIAEAADAKPIPPEHYIGTGPYKFVEWVPGRHIRLQRFEKYSSPPGPPNGFAGQRVAYIDELMFVPVPTVGTRVAGVQAGDYHYADDIPTDLYDIVARDPRMAPILLTRPPIYPAMVFNMRQGLMANNQLLRQAILATLDMEPILRTAYGDQRFWDLDGSYFAPGIIWYTTAGTEAYNQANPAKGKQLAEQAGYKGEPIRFLVTADYKHHYDQARVIAKQLKDAGFNVDLQIYDWPTLLSRRAKPELWEIFFSHYLTVPDPAIVLFLPGTYVGWWVDPKKDALVKQLNATTDFEQRYAIWEEIHKLFYEQVPFIKIGDAYFLEIMSAKVKGIGTSEHPIMIIPYFWNAWLE